MEGLMFASAQTGLMIYTKPAGFLMRDAANCYQSGEWLVVIDTQGNTLAKYRLESVVGVVCKRTSDEIMSDNIQVLQ